MNNKPVAWYAEKFSGEMVFATSPAERGHLQNKGLEVIPLYTHPVKEQKEEKSYEVVFDGEKYTTKLTEPKVKELTDKEILQLWVQKNNLNGASDIVDFAKAILRKAQEK